MYAISYYSSVCFWEGIWTVQRLDRGMKHFWCVSNISGRPSIQQSVQDDPALESDPVWRRLACEQETAESGLTCDLRNKSFSVDAGQENIPEHLGLICYVPAHE